MSAEIKDKATQRHIETLISKLRRRQLVGSQETALETALLLRQVVSTARFSSFDQLIAMLKGVGKRLVNAQPKEHIVGNVVRKVLHLIREEYSAAAGTPEDETIAFNLAKRSSSELRTLPSLSSPIIPPSSPASFSLANFVLLGKPRHDNMVNHSSGASTPNVPQSKSLEGSKPAHLTEDDFTKKNMAIKPVLIQAIQEVIDELETVYENVAKNAKDHIHSDEIVLTIGMSRTVEAFLKSAAHYRKFTVIVAETAPSYSGHAMARSLADAGISTFLVPDSSIYALMSRINKIILGAHAVLANGGLFAISGSLLAATAARAHATPVVVCAGQFKLTPLWNLYHEYGQMDFGNPGAVLGFEEHELIGRVEVVNPYYDYVEPDLVDVLITNDGDHPPSYVYRLVKDTYDTEDSDF